MLKGSLLRSPWSDRAEIRTRPRYYGCPPYMQKMKIRSKMKALECYQDYMSFFSDAQGQLTRKSGGILQISNSSKLLWLFSLLARMKKIQSKMMAQEC